MDNQDFMQYAEAIKLFINAGLSKTTFQRKVREGKIQKILSEDRQRGAIYSVADISKIIDQQRRKRKLHISALVSKKDTSGETDWVKLSDLPYTLALDYEMYGIEESVDLSITHHWVQKNPFMSRVLYNAENRKDIWGYITLIPLDEEIIFKLLRREMHERDIQAEHIHTYDKGGDYTVYAASVVIRPNHRAAFRDLMNSVLSYWCAQYPKINLKKVYAYADSDEGWSLIKHLFFAPRYDIGEKAFELNPHKVNPSKIIQSFQDCLKEREISVPHEKLSALSDG